jgi:hypothetical protein
MSIQLNVDLESYEKVLECLCSVKRKLCAFVQEHHPSHIAAFKRSPHRAVRYARYVLGRRWHAAEKVIAANPHSAMRYAQTVLKKRWRQAEPVIMCNADCACRYARYVIKGRWRAAERVISLSPEASYNYARYVIRGRWLKGEPAIMRSPNVALQYALKVIGGRWAEAEGVLCERKAFAKTYGKEYVKDFDESTAALCPYWTYRYAIDVVEKKLPPRLHNQMLMWSMSERYKKNSYVRRYLTNKIFP